MTQGLPHEKALATAQHAWKMARSRDTLHLLALVLRDEAQARGDAETVRLIEDTLGRLTEGDKVKIELVQRIRNIEETGER